MLAANGMMGAGLMNPRMMGANPAMMSQLIGSGLAMPSMNGFMRPGQMATPMNMMMNFGMSGMGQMG